LNGLRGLVGPGILLALLVAGCDLASDNPAGFEYTGRGPSAVLTDTLYATGADTTWSVPVPLRGADRVLVGRFEGFTAVTLIRFEGLPEDAVVQEAALSFQRRTSFTAVDDPGALIVDIQPVTSPWDSTWTGADLGSLTLDPPVDNFSLTFATTDTVGFAVPTALVQSWVDDPMAARLGLALTTLPTAPWLVTLYSNESSTSSSGRRPRLRIRYAPAGGGSTRIETVFASLDLSLVTFDNTPPPDELWLARGASYRTLLNFDISGIPPEATINRAVLRLGIIPGTALGAPLGMAAALPATRDPWALPAFDMVESGTSTFSVSVIEEDSTAVIVVTNPISELIAGVDRGRGLLLFAASEFTGVGLIRLRDSTAPLDQRARLEVFYSVPPGGTP
jgi:hypothetical protein